LNKTSASGDEENLGDAVKDDSKKEKDKPKTEEEKKKEEAEKKKQEFNDPAIEEKRI